jgi:predicted dienelactone hydrolase
MRTVSFLSTLSLIGLIGGASTHAQAKASGSGYRLEPGPAEAATIERLTLHDGARQKDLYCAVRYPKDAEGALPLVVFSHGAGGDSRAFSELSSHWASWGYVVVHPTHSDSVRLRMEQGEDISDVRKEMRNIVSKVDLPSRVADIRFILDSIPEIEKATGARVDRERIAMAGHSAGALTTQVIAGVKIRAARRFGGKGTFLSVNSAGDPRIKAALVISGQGPGRLLTEDSWDELTLPMLVITGSNDTSMVTDETPESRRKPYELAKPGDKYLLWIEGATHSSFGGGPNAAVRAILGEAQAENIEMIVDSTSSATTAFLDAYLRSDTGAKAYLRSDALEEFSQGKATLEHK